ncbi:MAG TPA: hypothetical protein VFO31_26690 [Vicinamibacterales bacterium]|nr:hypothetical protein [Vicinamibacterales bacterium]
MPVTSRFSLFAVAVTCAASLASSPASAQTTPAVGVSAGFMNVAEGELAMPGFYVEGERRLTRMVSAIGQVHRATGSGEGYFSAIDWTDLFVGGGLRVSGRPAPWVEPYAQVLVGPYTVTTVETARRTRFGVGTDDRYTDSYIATIAGGGVTLMASPRVGFRVGLDLQFFQDTLPNARLTAGAVVRIGR